MSESGGRNPTRCAGETESTPRPLRILCISEMWLGSNARAAFMALRRLGHSIQVIDEDQFALGMWRTIRMRIARRLLRPLLVQELRREAERVANTFQPDGLFVFKGTFVHPEVVRFYKQRGTPAANFFPDVSFLVHGPYLPKALPLYDHVFTTKSWGITDMQTHLGVSSASFLEHGFDPELHLPYELTEEDKSNYGSDVTFIGTWSPKKERLLAHLKAAMPNLRLRIWGSQWEKCQAPELSSSIVGDEIIGAEYAKALRASRICLGLLSEQRRGASSGDLITSRTFNIPACEAFMLHERNEEAVRYFKEDEEAAFFETPEELVRKVRQYLPGDEARLRVARNGRQRCLCSGYSLSSRMQRVSAWFLERAG